jgi:hypothetical protein
MLSCRVEPSCSTSVGCSLRHLQHATPRLPYPPVHLLLGIYAGGRCTEKNTYNTFRNWQRSPLWFVRFCSIRLFLVIFVDVNLLLCRLHPRKTGAVRFSTMTQTTILLQTASNLTHPLRVIIRTAFWQVPVSGMVRLWAMCLLGVIQLLSVFSSCGTTRMNSGVVVG